MEAHESPRKQVPSEADEEYGPDSFPASDPPSTWWGGGKDTVTETSEPSSPARTRS